MENEVRLKDLLVQDKEGLEEVHARSLDLLETTGIRFYSKRARAILDGAGARIDGDIVKLPAQVVEAALAKAPSQFTLYARDPKHDLAIDGGRTYYSQDGCAAHTLDFEAGTRRASTKADIEAMALISDYLDAVDIVSPTVSAQDVPPAGIVVHELEACFLNSGKHVLTESVTNAREAQAQIELAATVVGGKGELRSRPIFSNFVCTISPLTQDHGGIEAALEFADAGIPVGIYPMSTTGVTSPVTLAGTLAVANAEVISALSLLQLAAPGAKVFYSGGPATIDLRTGAYTATSPEAIWLRTMIAKMASHYNLPSIVGAGATSAKLPGAQAAWENAFSYAFPSLAGASVLFGLGLLDGSNLLTYEQILLDAEMAAMLRRLLSGVAFDATAFALPLVGELGPGGVYLDQQHTVSHMRRALSLPGIADRDSYDEWSHKGQAGRVTVARRKVQEILASHEAPPLPAATREAMTEIVEAYSRA
ncbi:MAG: trimethylamine methyltransferase family protein [Anaerolineae bacterium]|jgi:trimethylamine--corrinoid protein Co-methyltransferase